MAEVPDERRRLSSLAYRMLGTMAEAEAEDAVQETYLRWCRLTDDERAAIGNPQGWLTRVASRVCLDVLGSARHRRERYVGEWLPEPVPAQLFPGPEQEARDPLDRITLDESVSTAVLVVMETMTPAERVAVVRAFVRAARTGDLASLAALLDPSVTLRAGGGGVVRAALRPVLGVDEVARFLLGVVRENPGTGSVEELTGDGLAYRFDDGAGVRALLNLRVRAGLVTDVWIQMNPGKLGSWRRPDAVG